MTYTATTQITCDGCGEAISEETVEAGTPQALADRVRDEAPEMPGSNMSRTVETEGGDERHLCAQCNHPDMNEAAITLHQLAEMTPMLRCPECNGRVVRGTNRGSPRPTFTDGQCTGCGEIFDLHECETEE